MSGHVDLDDPPPEARAYAALYEREHKRAEDLESRLRTSRAAAAESARTVLTALDRIQELDTIVKAAVLWVQQEEHGSDDGASEEALHGLVKAHIARVAARQ